MRLIGSRHGVALSPQDRAAIVYTSGSTGKPKGATLRHANIVANTHSIVQYLQLSPYDRVMVVLPFHYVYGKSLLNTHVAAGGSVVIENGFLFPQKALDTLERTAVHGFLRRAVHIRHPDESFELRHACVSRLALCDSGGWGDGA